MKTRAEVCRDYYIRHKAEIKSRASKPETRAKRNVYLKRWREGDYERIHNIEKRRAGKFKRRFQKTKRIAMLRGLDFTLTEEECLKLIDEPCHYCQNRLGQKTHTYLGLDRLDPKVGYISGNCVPCCKVCNYIKSNILTAEETFAAIAAILAVRYKEQPPAASTV